jgi:hypothetical protein
VSQARLDSSFDKDFENLFNTEVDAKDSEDWADVAAETRVKPATSSYANEPPSVTRLPVLNALARPNELFASTAPYILIVEERGATIVVQCSHEPSLELLAAYLNKWGKSNPNDSLKVS